MRRGVRTVAMSRGAPPSSGGWSATTIYSFRELFMNGVGRSKCTTRSLRFWPGRCFPGRCGNFAGGCGCLTCAFGCSSSCRWCRGARVLVAQRTAGRVTASRPSRRRPYERRSAAHALNGPAGKVVTPRGRPPERAAFRNSGADSILISEPLAGGVAGFCRLLQIQTASRARWSCCPARNRLEYPWLSWRSWRPGAPCFPVFVGLRRTPS